MIGLESQAVVMRLVISCWTPTAYGIWTPPPIPTIDFW